MTYPDNNVRTYVYNEQTLARSTDLPNAMTGIVDEKGDRFATFGYNSSGRGISTEHAGGVDKFQLNCWTPYDTTIVTDPLGVSHSYWFQNTQGTYSDLRTDFVATQAVSPVVMVSGSDQFRRTLAGGL